jgi:hypothetical protein
VDVWTWENSFRAEFIAWHLDLDAKARLVGAFLLDAPIVIVALERIFHVTTAFVAFNVLRGNTLALETVGVGLTGQGSQLVGARVAKLGVTNFANVLLGAVAIGVTGLAGNAAG